MQRFPDWDTFVKAYNDIETYPDLSDIAAKFDCSYQTVRNKASVYRSMAKKNKKLPKIIDRSVAGQARILIRKEETLPPQDHARIRAQELAEDVTELVTRSRYPLINPAAIVVESAMTRRYNRQSRRHELVEGTPRTWISDTLRVAPIKDCRGRKFIFSGAQNDTEIHEGFWKNLQAYAKAIKAEIVIGPWTYETQWWSENNPTARSYDPALTDYLCFGQMEIGSNFIFAGEMNTLPTASKPISDLVTYSRGRWAVFPHAKRQLKSVPSTDPAVQASHVLTTGSVTQPKVIPRKAGVKSIFHHVIGAVVVEFDKDGDIFARHISADHHGAFYDLDAYVKDGKITRGHRAKVVTMPDAHRAKMGPRNARALFGLDLKTGKKVKGSLVDALNPEHVTWQDLFDNETRNHHHAKDPMHNYEQAVRGRDKVITELEEAADFLIRVQRPGTEDIVVEGNHDLALQRYILEGRFRFDGINARLGNELERELLDYHDRIAEARRNYTSAPSFSLLETALRHIAGKKIERVSWVHDGCSRQIDGIEHGHHGFRGANGAKGSVAGFARMGRKMTIGDKHSPEIDEGVYVAGTMELQHGYNKGPSGWSVSVVVQYQDGKRSIVTLQKGKFRA